MVLKSVTNIIKKMLDLTTKDKIIEKCIKYLKDRIGNRKLQKDIMRSFNLTDKGLDIIVKNRGIKKATDVLASFDISVTGTESGNILMGTSDLTRNSIIKLHPFDNKSSQFPVKMDKVDIALLKIDKNNKKLIKLVKKIDGFIYPEKRRLDHLRNCPTIWKQFIRKLGSVQHFKNMSEIDREEWLYVNEAGGHNDEVVGDINYIQFLQSGNGIVKKLNSDSSIDKLLQGNTDRANGYWTSREIENLFPKKPGSKARKHTLVLIRSFWRINNAFQVVTEHKNSSSEVVLDVSHSMTKNKTKHKNKYYILRDINTSIGDRVVIKVNSNTCTKDISTGNIDDNLLKVYKELKKKFGNLPPSFYKSIIQKIIRYRPKKILFPKYMNVRTLDTEKVLVACVLILANHPGSFVPDIQRYVTGREACFKRLAVSIIEDSYTNSKDLATLLSCAMLSQRVKSWLPNKDIINLLVKSAKFSLKTDKYFEYSIRRGKLVEPIKLSNDTDRDRAKGMNHNLNLCSGLLDEIKSFDTDLWMMRDIANTNGVVRTGNKIRPKLMKIEHSVDQHWATGFTYFMDMRIINSVCKNNNSKTFKPLFNLIWDKSSGMNVRKKDYNESRFVNDNVVKAIRKAQKYYLMSYHASRCERIPLQKKFYNKSVTLNDGWLASLVGTLDVGLSPPSLVTINPENICKFIAIRRPSRDNNSVLSEKQKQKAIDKAIDKLKKGVSLNSATAPLPILKGAIVKLIEKTIHDKKSGRDVKKLKYEIHIKKSKYDWDDVKTTTLKFPIYGQLTNDTETSLTHTGKGVEVNHKKKLKMLLDDTDVKILRRVMYYLSGFNSEINMNRISRDGGGIQKAMTIEDVGSYQFLLKISHIYCGALRPKMGAQIGFKVESIVLLEEIKDNIKTKLSSVAILVTTDIKKNVKKNWKKIKDKKKRKLWDHQKYIIKELGNSNNNGERGSFVWLRVGMGKTLIVLKYIQELISKNELPKYIVYTLPDSSLKSIIDEISQFGLKINIVTSKERIVKPYHVNLVTSDHNLRICEKLLIGIADEALFIVDEVHKAMNDTQRTTVALNIVSLSKYFVVMTGTPVIDSKTYKLISWLKMIVPYEVNERNYLVAANSMLTKNVETGIKVLREDIEANMSYKHEKKYIKLVPLALGGTNTNPTFNGMKRASDLCYKTCDKEMIVQTIKYLKHGVMLVAKDINHQKQLYKMLLQLKQKDFDKSDIYLMGSGKSLILTDDSVKETGIDYKIVIVPMKKAEGYTLTRLSVMIRSVYPSNQATRTQIEGRINRIGQKAEYIKYIIVHTGILTNIMNKHSDAKSLELALMKMAKK